MRGQAAYLAAPIFNVHQLEVVEAIKTALEVRQFEVFSPYHESRAIWKGRAPKDCTPEERAQVLRGNIQHLSCKLVVAWVGGYEQGFTDPGVVWEMGYAGALSGTPAAFDSLPNYPVVLAYIHDTDVRQAMNLMLAGTVDAVAKGHRELSDALDMAAKREYTLMASQFHPDHHLATDKEPIV